MYKLIIAILMISNAVQAATPQISNRDPRSYEEFIGKDPHPDWIKSGQVSVNTVNAFSEVQLPNTKFVTQPHTNPISAPTPCSKYFGITPETITTIDVVPTTDTVAIGFSGQFSLPEGNGFAGAALVCSVKQGDVTYACSGVSGEPVIMSRTKTSQSSPVNAWRSSAVSYTGYHGFVNNLIPNEPVTVTIYSRILSVPTGSTGQVCYGSMEVSY